MVSLVTETTNAPKRAVSAPKTKARDDPRPPRTSFSPVAGQDAATCLTCGRQFWSKHAATRKYCTQKCAATSKVIKKKQPIDRGTRVCPGCGTVVKITTRNRRSTHCTLKCAVASTQRTATERTCEQCGKVTLRKKSDPGRFCSRACMNANADFKKSRGALAGAAASTPETNTKRNATRRKHMDEDPSIAQAISDRMVQRWQTNTRMQGGWSKRAGGRREDLGNRYFRSSWEANIARYLNLLVSHGSLHRWEYEPDTFEFHAIKRGVRSYTPDFKLWDTPESEPYYWEVKGWDHPRGRTARARMSRYYPHIRVELIGPDAYKAIAKSHSFIPGWEKGKTS